MSKGVERNCNVEGLFTPRWRVLVGQAVPRAETMEVNPDSARDGMEHAAEPPSRFPRTGSLSFSARLQASRTI